MRLVLFLVLQIQFNVLAGQRVWIDYDVAIGKPFRDVDDALALITALKSSQLDIVGISYSFGNISNLDYMEKMTKKILTKTQRLDIPIYKGALNKKSLGKKTPAVRALVVELKKEPLTILSMGRFTTVATVVHLFPHLKSQIKEVIVNAGRLFEYETKVGKQKVIMPDTNVDDHLEAAEWLVTSNVQITMIPTELMADKFVTKKHLRKMRKGTKLSRWMARKSSFWRMLWRIFPGAPGFIPWDTFMVSYLIYPEDFQCYQKIPIQLKWMTNNTSSLFRKKYRADKKYFLTASYQFQSSVLGTYCYHITDNHLDKIVSLWLEP